MDLNGINNVNEEENKDSFTIGEKIEIFWAPNDNNWWSYGYYPGLIIDVKEGFCKVKWLDIKEEDFPPSWEPFDRIRYKSKMPLLNEKQIKQLKEGELIEIQCGYEGGTRNGFFFVWYGAKVIGKTENGPRITLVNPMHAQNSDTDPNFIEPKEREFEGKKELPSIRKLPPGQIGFPVMPKRHIHKKLLAPQNIFDLFSAHSSKTTYDSDSPPTSPTSESSSSSSQSLSSSRTDLKKPKKRGRPKKENFQTKDEDNPIEKLPKKRGRKPKRKHELNDIEYDIEKKKRGRPKKYEQSHLLLEPTGHYLPMNNEQSGRAQKKPKLVEDSAVEGLLYLTHDESAGELETSPARRYEPIYSTPTFTSDKWKLSITVCKSDTKRLLRVPIHPRDSIQNLLDETLNLVKEVNLSNHSVEIYVINKSKEEEELPLHHAIVDCLDQCELDKVVVRLKPKK